MFLQRYTPTIPSQRGAALMVMLVIMVIGIATVLVGSLSSAALKSAHQQQTSDALAQAKDALIGYAMTYGDTHPGQVHGYLPCPDNALGNPEGTAELSCGLKDVSFIGRLPWATLDLPTLRDGNGECLWYAVSGTYKNSPKTSLMNWDTNGQFQVYASDGTLLTTDPGNQVVAVIFAPGAALNGQDRSGTTAPVCGGNYTATNYLENDTVHSIDNTNISVGKFIQGTSGGSVNDQMVYITRQDIWNAIKKRNDLGTFISTLLGTATACGSQPVTVNFSGAAPVESTGISVGSLTTGRVPKSCLTSPLNNWQDNLLYATCTSGGCLTVNGTNCDGMVIFSGERNSSQIRINNAQKNSWNNYLENVPSTNLTTFTAGGVTYSGAASYVPATPSTDILACI